MILYSSRRNGICLYRGLYGVPIVVYYGVVLYVVVESVMQGSMWGFPKIRHTMLRGSMIG